MSRSRGPTGKYVLKDLLPMSSLPKVVLAAQRPELRGAKDCDHGALDLARSVARNAVVFENETHCRELLVGHCQHDMFSRTSAVHQPILHGALRQP